MDEWDSMLLKDARTPIENVLDTLEANIYMPRASKTYKDSYLQSLKEDLISSNALLFLLS